MKKEPTQEEKDLKKALESYGLRVLSQVYDGHKHIDLSIPDARINIEIDGPKHLTNAYQVLADLTREHYSDVLGYDTIHIPNEQIHFELDKIAKALAGAAKIKMKPKKLTGKGPVGGCIDTRQDYKLQ